MALRRVACVWLSRYDFLALQFALTSESVGQPLYSSLYANDFVEIELRAAPLTDAIITTLERRETEKYQGTRAR
ncbi:hypothetical protein FB451DRAFT_1206333 [Mycena latifolia]|nr:hypothetical protein FB451DRAFT_1206333 [Mycena latifolia]